MTRDEKIEKIIDMTREIFELTVKEVSDKELDKLYVQTKIALEALKELNKMED